MMNLLELTFAVLKVGISDITENNILKEVLGISVGYGNEKAKECIKKWKSEFRDVLSEKSFRNLDINIDQRGYIKQECLDLLDAVRISDNLVMQHNVSSKELGDYLFVEYKNKHNKDIEYENDIKKLLLFISEKAVQLAKEDESFINTCIIDTRNLACMIDQKVDGLFKEMDNIKDNIKTSKVSVNHQECKNIVPLKNRAKEYKDIWNKNMFLHDFDDEDERAGASIKLHQLYMLPHYKLNGQGRRLESLEKRMKSYVSNKKELKDKMLLILGQPGIGKSTLITWFMAKIANNEEDILVYRFTDLKNIDWNNNDTQYDYPGKILSSLSLNKNKLYGKILILDGLDEINTGENRLTILNKLYDEWFIGDTIEDFCLLITCREHYIDRIHLLSCPYITLQPFSPSQIKDFYTSYCKTINKSNVIYIQREKLEKLSVLSEVFGIPLIIYSVLALDIEIQNETSMVDIYDKMFAIEGGIYDRCLNYKKWASLHRIGKGKVKWVIHEITCQIALWIFENNAEKASIPKEEYMTIVNLISNNKGINNYELGQDVLISNYFKIIKHCEGFEGEEISFIHRSIYEYFVSSLIFSTVKNAITKMNEDSQMEFAINISQLLVKGEITPTISEFFAYKVNKICKDKNISYNWFESAIDKMVNNSMVFGNINIEINYDAFIRKEALCFSNIITILNLLFRLLSNKQYIFDNSKDILMSLKLHIIHAAQYNKLNLSFMNLANYNFENEDLRKVNLTSAYLKNINLKSAIITEASLREANLTNAELNRSDLKHTTLRGANLKGANMKCADLRTTNLDATDLSGADLSGANLHGINLTEAKLSGVNFSKADLSYAKLKGKYLVCIQLREAKLEHAELRGANLTRADLEKASLIRADLVGINLTGADLTGADATGADLTGADLTRANLTGANLTGADLTGADLTEANLTGADLTDAILIKTDISKSIRANLTNAILTKEALKEYKKRLESLNGKI